MEIRNPHLPASEAQMKRIDTLLVRLGNTDTLDSPSPRSIAYKALSDGLTKGQASNWIDKLMELPIPEPDGDLKIVVEHLRKQAAAGKAGEFGLSLLGQFDKYGRLSEKQIACVLKRIKPETNSIAVPLVIA
ncbi:MAG: hypothetical protein H0T76_06275 [Nannocystis sp.]|nr:hypothetical protein [Nannocystis sp.]